MEDVYTMKDDELIDEMSNLSNEPSSGKPSTYDLLLGQSKKMGVVATKAFHEVKDILNRDIQFTSAEKFLSGFPRATKKQKELDAAAKLKKTIKRYHQVLGAARTVFPIKLFPDDIVVDRTKISIIKRDFFWTSNVISFRVEDVLNVSCSIGPLFGSLTIASRVMSSVDHFQINYLWRNDAIRMKHLIQGHIIAKQSNLETDKLTREEMIETLCELGVDSDR